MQGDDGARPLSGSLLILRVSPFRLLRRGPHRFAGLGRFAASRDRSRLNRPDRLNRPGSLGTARADWFSRPSRLSGGAPLELNRPGRYPSARGFSRPARPNRPAGHLRLAPNALEQIGAHGGGRLDRLQGRPEPAEGLIRHAEQVLVAPFAPLIVCSTRHARRFAVTGVLRSVVPVQPRHDSAPISLRSRAIPFLILVLTVPSGTPVRRAISVWVRPVK